MSQVTDLGIAKFKNTYSAAKQDALKDAIEGNASDVAEVFAIMRRAGQGFGLGTGTVSGTTGTTDLVGVGTAFTTELSAGDDIFIPGAGTVTIDTITDDTNIVLTGNLDATVAG